VHQEAIGMTMKNNIFRERRMADLSMIIISSPRITHS
jgi:hypothetical protein